jgi:hypothetical protein
MPIFKVKVNTYWLVEADDVNKAIDHVADVEIPELCSDYDSFETSVRKNLSEMDKVILIRLNPSPEKQMWDIVKILRPKFKLLSQVKQRLIRR